MKNSKGQVITYGDWRRVAKRFVGSDSRVVAYMEARYLSDTDEVTKPESFLFNVILFPAET